VLRTGSSRTLKSTVVQAEKMSADIVLLKTTELRCMLSQFIVI